MNRRERLSDVPIALAALGSVCLEVVVLQGALRGHPMSRVVDEHGCEQVDAVRVERLDSVGQVDGRPLRERRLVVGQLRDSWPDVLVGCAKDAARWGESGSALAALPHSERDGLTGKS